MYLHHKYKYHISFKCNNRQCNHTIKQLTPSAIDDPSSENLFGKDTFSGHRFSINTIINAINLYYSLNATTRAISTYLLDYMNIKVSHVTISKWIKKFDKYFKSISDELTKNLYLGDSDECHANETVVKNLGIRKPKDLSHLRELIALLATLFFTTILLNLIHHLVV